MPSVGTSALKDDDVASVAPAGAGMGDATYVVKNRLRSRLRYEVETPAVLRRLKQLEREGKVERVPTSYAVMICWRRAEEAPHA